MANQAPKPQPANRQRLVRRRLPERMPDFCKVCDRLAQAEAYLVAGDKEQAGMQLALAQAETLAVLTEALLIQSGSMLEVEKNLDRLTLVQATPHPQPAAWPKE